MSETWWGPERSKQISWWWPDDLAGQLTGLSGIEYLRGIIDGRFPPPPITSLMDSRLVSVAPGEAIFSGRPDQSCLNPIGLVHGGVLSTLLDSAMGIAVQTQAPAGVGYATIEMKVSFLRPLPWDGSEIEVRGRVLKMGNRVAFAEAHAYDGAGKLAGHGTSSLARVG